MECRVRFIYKRNAFLILFGIILQKKAPNGSINDRFYKGFYKVFLTLKIFIFNRFYKGFRNAFLVFEKPCFPLVS